MIRYKSDKEIALLKEGGKRLHNILHAVSAIVKPGVSTQELEDLARKLISDIGDTPAFLDYQPWGAKRPFPAALCVSINDEIVHGIPNEKQIFLKEGDIVSLDCGLIHEGLFTDSAITISVGKADAMAKTLIKATQEALDAGIAAVVVGGHVGDIGAAIAQVAKRYKFSIAQDLCGHGVGYGPHEDPYVPNEAEKGEGPVIKPGLVIAIEPMLNEGTGSIKLDADGYTYRTRDGGRSAHFEHTIAVTKLGVDVLTR
jgi:methionyl aminopeptidase